MLQTRKACATKNDIQLIKTFGFTPRISSSWQLSSALLTTDFEIRVASGIAASHIILGSSESMSRYLAIASSVLLHPSAYPFRCGVSGMAFYCRDPVNNLSGFFSAWVWSFVILANAHTLHTYSSSPTVSEELFNTSACFKWPNRLCHLLPLSHFTTMELILNSRTLQARLQARTLQAKLQITFFCYFYLSFLSGVSWSQLFSRKWSNVPLRACWDL